MTFEVFLHNSVAIGVLIAFAGLITNWVIQCRASKYRRSLFYFNEVRSNFDKALNLIVDGNNNCINWHHAGDLLRRSQKLALNITKEEHKKLYVVHFKDIQFKIGNLLSGIDSLKFFYGHPGYKNIDAQVLFDNSCKIISYSHIYNQPPEDTSHNFTYYPISVRTVSYILWFVTTISESDFHSKVNSGDQVYFNEIKDTEMSQQEAFDKTVHFPVAANYILDFQSRRIKKNNQNQEVMLEN